MPHDPELGMKPDIAKRVLGELSREELELYTLANMYMVRSFMFASVGFNTDTPVLAAAACPIPQSLSNEDAQRMSQLTMQVHERLDEEHRTDNIQRN